MQDAPLFELVGGLLHRLHVALGAHHDPHAWRIDVDVVELRLHFGLLHRRGNQRDTRGAAGLALGATLWAVLSVAVEDIDRIEVVRGPASALYGADAFNGVINIITKRPGEGGNGVAGGFGDHDITHGSVWASGRDKDFAIAPEGAMVRPSMSDVEVRALNASADKVAKSGGTPLAVAKDGQLLGIIHLKDIIKGGIRERFGELRQMGIRTVMITGDNPLTAAAIAAEAGVDDFLAQATPEAKLKLIRDEQAQGKLVAMCGDGTNDAPALAQADVGVAMNTGTMAAREAGNMVDLDSDPTKLIEIVEIGKQLLMTRGALTTFSIANDVAKYFAIIPAAFVVFYPQLQSLNIMHLATPQSAILSAIIFNALIIVALIPLSLRGVAYRPVGAASILRRNLLVYGLEGIVVPFIGIKLIDLVVGAIHLA